MARRLVIVGSAGLAKELAWVVRAADPAGERWDLMGLVTEEAAPEMGSDPRIPIIGDDAWLFSQEWEADVLIGIGHPGARQRATSEYLKHEGRLAFPNLIHPNAMCHDESVTMGMGNTVQARCIITVDIEIGNFNLINGMTTIGHDARIGDFNILNPCNVSGGVEIGDGVLIGTGAVILEGCRIGDGAVVGAGAVVRSDVEPGDTVVGIPAKPLQKKAP